MLVLVSSGKINVGSVDRGDIVMVVWNEDHNNFSIYTEPCFDLPLHFLHNESTHLLGLTIPPNNVSKRYVLFHQKSCSPDPTRNLNFHQFFDIREQVLKVASKRLNIHFILFQQPIWIFENFLTNLKMFDYVFGNDYGTPILEFLQILSLSFWGIPRNLSSAFLYYNFDFFSGTHLQRFWTKNIVRLRSQKTDFAFLKVNFSKSIFCQKLNGILFAKLFWSTLRKNGSSDREKPLKVEAENREFAKCLRSVEQFKQIVKGKNNYLKQNAF